MIKEYLTLWHLKWLVIYTLANCALPWYVIWRNKRLRPDSKRDLEKYLPWQRADYDEMSYWSCIFSHFFFIPRYCALLAILFWALITTKIISIGANIDDLSENRRWLILQNTYLCMKVFIRIIGVSSVSTRRPSVDYSKWLGPDWKPTYDGATMLVSNH